MDQDSFYFNFSYKIYVHPFIIFKQMQQASKLTYQPFKYPPDFALARIHQRASMPGRVDRLEKTCPCCKEKVKVPFKSWWGRNIAKDFKIYGGAVVTYFWLLKLYSISALIVVLVYAAYLQYLSNHYCGTLGQDKQNEMCSNLFGIWIISNEDLYEIIDDDSVIVRFFTLRSVAFLVLLATNAGSMYLIKWFKIRYPSKTDISDFSLLFKNLQGGVDGLLKTLKSEFGNIEVREALMIKKAEPYYSAYQKKLETYYAIKIEEKPKIKEKLIKALSVLDKFCSQNEDSFYDEGNRAILVFTSVSIKKKIELRYTASKWGKIRMFFSNSYEQEHGVYCESCPRVQEIIWNNIGKIENQNFQLKLLSVVYFFLILAFCFFFIYFLLEVVFIYNIANPFKSVLQNFIMIFIVGVALTFRQLMNRLSEMRFPNTYTSRTLFIVITTVLFHFIFYLFIPSTYLRVDYSKRGSILGIISNQALTFILVQITLAGFDLMYCCWNRRREKVQDEERPVGCQKMLHERIEYPRFPIEFKLIILFKIWSFITFFAFHVPLVLFMILLVLIFLYIKDKRNLYYHYRMEVIHNDVQFNFLRIYSNVFTVYMYIIFVFTQHTLLEYLIGAVVTIATVIFQTIYFRKLKIEEDTTADTIVTDTLEDLELDLTDISSYRERYENFIKKARSDELDIQIKQFLSKEGYGTMQTEESLRQKLI